MTTTAQPVTRRRISYSRFFSDRPEESLRLRSLSLLTLLSTGLSLSWITGDPTVPIVATVLATTGHWVSWHWRRSPLGRRSILIVALISGLSVIVREDFALSLTGDRLPLAEYLLLVGGISSFGLRTRGGLYAHLTASGVILFLVSERAFDQTFVGFLIVFTGLFLTFFAMAFLEDQISIARVHWPEGQLGRFWFWLGIVGGGLLVCSALAFSLLPPDYRGSSGSQRVGIVPFMGDTRSFGTAESPSAPDALSQGMQSDEASTPGGISETGGGQKEGLGNLDALVPEDFRSRQVEVDARDLVMHVRSDVTSYWRGRLFDRFDGQQWHRSISGMLSRPVPAFRNYYWHAFFMEREEPHSLFAGYSPIRTILPEEIRERGFLTAGSTYSVLSQQPELSAGSMSFDLPGNVDGRYLRLPTDSDGVRELANEIVGDASTPFERLWLIVTHLRQNHSYDGASSNPLQLSQNVEDFLIVGTTGNSLDFATATVLMARAAGVPARLAVGYLPGKFDPFRGTHKVRNRDAHAWAEVSFRRHGWVAFDSAPRPELEVFASASLGGYGATSFIFQTRVGGGLYHIIQSGASEALDSFSQVIKGPGRLLTGLAGVAGAIVIGWAIFFLLKLRVRRTRQGTRYSRLSGDSREEILRSYHRMERLLRRRGHRSRDSYQTLEEYQESAVLRFGAPTPELEWLTRAAWAAAYDPEEPGAGVVREARSRLTQMGRRRLEPRLD